MRIFMPFHFPNGEFKLVAALGCDMFVDNLEVSSLAGFTFSSGELCATRSSHTRPWLTHPDLSRGVGIVWIRNVASLPLSRISFQDFHHLSSLIKVLMKEKMYRILFNRDNSHASIGINPHSNPTNRHITTPANLSVEIF